jgi:hypothetical protein
MKRSALAVASIAISLVVMSSGSAVAGPYADELAKCLVRSTTDADKNYLIKWMFASMALHPEVKSIASVTDAQRNELNKHAGKLFERLVAESCKAQTQDALRYEGPSTLEAGFQVLGQVAARGLFSDPAVAKGMSDFGKHIDNQRLEKLFGAAR